MLHNDILDHFHFDDLPDWAGEGEVVAKYYGSMEAEVAAARLRAEGIHCFLANTVSNAVVPHLQGIVRLHTRPTDADRARELLQEASLETTEPLARRNSGMGAVIILGIIIVLILAWTWVQAMR